MSGYGECSERLTAFGGLLALVKFLDLIGFEEKLRIHYVHPQRESKLGGCFKFDIRVGVDPPADSIPIPTATPRLNVPE